MSAWIRLPLKLVAAAMVLVVLLLVADFAFGMLTSVKIVNASGADLRRVEISWNDMRAWSASVEDGHEREFIGSTPVEGVVRVHIETSDGRSRTEDLGYVTPGLGGRYFVTVRRPFDVAIVWCDGGIFTNYCTG